jgi:cellobiose-specific phosphotransferase system component IIB
MAVNKIISFLLNIILLNFFLVDRFIHAKNKQKQGTSLDVCSLSEMTVEGGVLDIQLISPTVNLFDLEPKVKGKQKVSIVNDAKVLLSNTVLFFSFSGRSYSLMNSAIDVSALMKLDRNINKYQLKNKKNSYDAHRIQGVRHKNHNQVVANYRYRNLSKLLSIKIKLFAIYQGIQDIYRQWIIEKRQGAMALNASYNIIHLR